MSGWFLDRPVSGPFDARDMLGLAWLCEQAARSCDVDGDAAWGEQLRRDASRCRALAMREPEGRGR